MANLSPQLWKWYQETKHFTTNVQYQGIPTKVEVFLDQWDLIGEQSDGRGLLTIQLRRKSAKQGGQDDQPQEDEGQA